MAWDRFFIEPRLQALIRLALEHNRDLRVAALNVEQARAQAVIREADLWPTVNLGVGGIRVPTNTGGVSTTVTGGLAVTAYEIDLFGRVRQQASAAQAQLQASEFLQAAARASLIAAVASAHANLQADEALLSVTQDTLKSREENLKIVQGRVRSGAASALELVQAESLLQAARAALAQVQRQRALDESALVLLVGRPLPTGRCRLGPRRTTVHFRQACPPRCLPNGPTLRPPRRSFARPRPMSKPRVAPFSHASA
jgi:outer membrane protein TolC